MSAWGADAEPGSPDPAGSTPHDRTRSIDADALIDLLDEAVRATPEEREALLARVAARDASQAAELRALIEALPDPELTTGTGEGARSSPSGVSHLEDGFVGEPVIGETIGGCVLEAVLGRGGAGTVFAARQFEPPRPVAVKVLRTAHARLSHIRRFQTEALALARLEHPSIVRIYASGVARREGVDLPYIVMERIESSEDFVTWARRPGRTHREIAARLADVCDGMQQGHSRGLMHRDLKPSNVLVAADGRPRVIDFGVARILGDENARAEETIAGVLIGTPAYMAPEQFELASSELDVRVDVHALGTILYEALTGRRPFEIPRHLAYDAARIMRESTPVSVDRIDATIPRDLAAIVSKATARERERRYATAAEFAEDLRAFVDGRAVRARPERRAERAVRWVRRNPAWTTAILVVAVALVAATTFSAVQWREARHELMLASLARAATASSELDLGGAAARIAEAKRVSDGRIPPFIFGMLEAPFDGAVREYAGLEQGHRMAGTLSPDRRRWIASGDGDVVHVVDLVTHEVVATKIPSGSAFAWGCGFTPDSARAFVGCEKGMYEVLPDGRCEPRLEIPMGQVRGFVPTTRGTAGFYFFPGSQSIARFVPDGPGEAEQVTFSPGSAIGSIAGAGSRLYAAAADGGLYAVDIDAEGRLSKDSAFQPPRGRGVAVAVSADGALLARGLYDGRVQLLDPTTGASLDEEYVRHDVKSLAFTPSGGHLYAGDRAGRVHRYRVERTSGSPRLEPVGVQRTRERDPVWAIGALDETQVVANISFGVVRLDFSEAWSPKPQPFPGGFVVAASEFDGRRMRALDNDGRVYELDLQAGAWTQPSYGELGMSFVQTGGVSRDGRVAIGWDGGRILVLDVETGARRELDAPNPYGRVVFAWSPKGDRVACVFADRMVVLDRSANAVCETEVPFGVVRCVEWYAPAPGDSTEIAVCTTSDAHRVHRITLRGDSIVSSDAREGAMLLTRSGGRFVHSGLGGPIRVFRPGGIEVFSGEPEIELVGHIDVATSTAISPDGAWLASGGEDGTVRVWNLGLAECFLPLRGPGGKVTIVRWAPDGRSIVAVDQFGATRFYDSVPRRERLGVEAR